MSEEYVAKMSEEIERTVTKKLSQAFSRTVSHILGALSKLDKFLLNPQVRTCSANVPGKSWNNDSENWEPTGDRSLNDLYPEVEFSVRHASTSVDSNREETSHKLTFTSVGQCIFTWKSRGRSEFQSFSLFDGKLLWKLGETLDLLGLF